MKRYEAYKDSGVDWIGEIPEEWDVIKIKRFSKTLAGGTPSTDNLKFWDGNIPWLPSGKLQNCDINSAEKFITELGLSKSATKYIRENTTLIALTGATCANIGYLKFKATANQSVVAIENDENQSNSRFLFYALMNERPRILLNQTGGAQAGINENDVKNILITFPPLSEQTAIAQFLDDKTAKIDQTIGIRQKEIELLKERRQILIQQAVTKGLDATVPMKDSGVDWIGEIPEHWEVRRLKYVFKILKRIAGREGYNILSITQKGIKVKNISSGEGQIAADYSNYQFCNKGEFAMNHMDLLTGWVDISQFNGVISPDYRVFESIIFESNNNYLLKLLQQCYINKAFYANGQGVSMLGRWRFPTENFNNFSFPIPPVGEQSQIVSYLEGIEAKIAKAIKLKEQEIEKLKEYKTVLINQVVTGKVRVS